MSETAVIGGDRDVLLAPSQEAVWEFMTYFSPEDPGRARFHVFDFRQCDGEVEFAAPRATVLDASERDFDLPPRGRRAGGRDRRATPHDGDHREPDGPAAYRYRSDGSLSSGGSAGAERGSRLRVRTYVLDLASAGDMRHGEAVARGMLAAAEVSRSLRYLGDGDVERQDTAVGRLGVRALGMVSGSRRNVQGHDRRIPGCGGGARTVRPSAAARARQYG